MSSRGRYLTPAEFGRVLADLRITPTIFQDPLLEWLEAERIVLPAARVRWPASTVLASRGVAGAPPPTGEERSATEALQNALRLWNRYDSDPEVEHPLDRPDPPGAALVQRNLGDRPFEAWDSMRTDVAPTGSPPVYVSAVTTYYHEWQALLVADATEMGVRIVFDTRDAKLLSLATASVDDLTGLAPVHRYHFVSFEAPRGLSTGVRWGAYFDAAARLDVARERKLAAIGLAHGSEPWTLEGAELAEFRGTSKRAAVARATELGASPGDLVRFIAFLSGRWDDWSRRGRAELVQEYARCLRRAVRLATEAFDVDPENIETEVGAATADGVTRLSAIFKDWTRGAHRQLDASLRHAIVPRAPMASPDLALTDSDVTDLLEWMRRRESWKVHLSVDEIIKRQFDSSNVSREAHAAAVETLAVTFEQLVGDLLDEVGIPTTGAALFEKMKRLWSNDADVRQVLEAEHGLVATRLASRSDQLAAIAALPATSQNTGVVQTLLRAVLYRNDGLHNSMSAWAENELHDATIAFLTALLFCRKHTLVNARSR